MSPLDEDRPEELDDWYRRASALDRSQPGETVRRAVLAHAAQLAAERRPPPTAARHRARGSWWRPALYGTLAAAALAGLAIAPQLLSPDTRHVPSLSAPPSRQPARLAPARKAFPLPPAALPEAARAASPPRVRSAPHRTQASALPEVQAPASAPVLDREAPVEPAPNAARGSEAPAASADVYPSRLQALGGSAAHAAASLPSRSAVTSFERHALQQLPQAARPGTALRRAAEQGNIPRLQALLLQADINSRDAAGRTALMLATLHGQVHAVDVLLAHGADPSAADARNMTPLKAAIAGHQSAIVQALRRAGAR